MNVAPDWKKTMSVHSKGELRATLIKFAIVDVPAQELRQPFRLATAMAVIGVIFPPKPGQFWP